MIIDLAQLEQILSDEPQNSETSELPSFIDHGGSGYKATPPITELPLPTRVQNLEIQLKTMEKLIMRLADELRTQRQGIEQIAFNIKHPNTVRM